MLPDNFKMSLRVKKAIRSSLLSQSKSNSPVRDKRVKLTLVISLTNMNHLYATNDKNLRAVGVQNLGAEGAK